MTKIKRLSTIGLAVLLPYLFLYPYFALDFQVRMVFLDPTLWENHRWVEPGTQIAVLTKLIYLLVWLLPTAFGMAALWAAISITRCFRSGMIFDDKVARLIIRLGRYLAASAALAISAGCVTPMIISWHNPSGAMDLSLWISVPNMGLLLCGLAFLLMGSVLREGIVLARENEAFI